MFSWYHRNDSLLRSLSTFANPNCTAVDLSPADLPSCHRAPPARRSFPSSRHCRLIRWPDHLPCAIRALPPDLPPQPRVLYCYSRILILSSLTIVTQPHIPARAREPLQRPHLSSCQSPRSSSHCSTGRLPAVVDPPLVLCAITHG